MLISCGYLYIQREKRGGKKETGKEGERLTEHIRLCVKPWYAHAHTHASRMSGTEKLEGQNG